MTGWVVWQHTEFCTNRWEERLYNAVIGLVYCFSFFSLKEGRSRYRQAAFQVELEKTRVFKKNQPMGFFGFFGGFLVFFLYICPEERVFRVFSVSRILLGASRLKIIITHTN